MAFDFLKDLFSNKLIQNTAFGSIKKVIKENKLKCIIVSVDPATDDIKLEFINNENQLIDGNKIS